MSQSDHPQPIKLPTCRFGRLTWAITQELQVFPCSRYDSVHLPRSLTPAVSQALAKRAFGVGFWYVKTIAYCIIR